VYATFLLWMLSELFERLPEVGDPDKPKLVFFFDEAHLLFTDAPQALVEKIEQVVRLIRSKGIGVYFVTQNPADVPELVLGQLGNRVQHALRAFTPRDQKAVNVAADTLRPNPKIDTARAITELAVGEALVSVLDEKGTPTITERAWIAPPASQIGPIPDADREAIRKRSLGIYGHYEQTVDRESAYEKLNARTEVRTGGVGGAGAGTTATQPSGSPTAGEGGITDALSKILLGSTGPRGGRREGMLEAAAKSAARSVGSSFGRAILRGALGGILGGGRSRR
jgi:DNA helicase HerA-like ATPase